MKPVILITGATGKTGSPLVRELSAAGVPVRAMIHTLTRKPALEHRNVESVAADFKDSRSLAHALQGIKKAYLVSPVSPDQVRFQTHFVDQAREAGVKHIVKLSALGAAPDSPVGLLRWHAEIEEYIRKSGIPYTFLHSHFFMENLLAEVDAVNQDRALASPLGDARIGPVSVQDIAAVAARILIEGGHLGKAYVLTGPETVTYGEIAATMSEVLGIAVKYIPVSFETAKQRMLQSGMPLWLADDLVRLMKTWVEGKGGIASRHVENITGKKPVSIREFFLNNRGLFQAAA